jgi:hypothetical protein
MALDRTYEAFVALDAGADPRAVGGAVTVALCGHWEHDGACRWPHHTAAVARPGPEGGLRSHLAVTVSYDCDDDEAPEVRLLIAAAIASGRLAGPDGRLTTWQVVDA